MSKHIIADRFWRAAGWAPIVSCLALGACSSAGEGSFFLLADPGKYQYHNCKQIADTRDGRIGRRKELKLLIEKAEQGTAGVVVAALAYRSEYAAVGEEIETLNATAREKNCPPPPAPPTRRSDTVIQ